MDFLIATWVAGVILTMMFFGIQLEVKGRRATTTTYVAALLWPLFLASVAGRIIGVSIKPPI